MKLIPFLSFDGKTHEAMAFYAQVLEGKVTSEMKYRDAAQRRHGRLR